MLLGILQARLQVLARQWWVRLGAVPCKAGGGGQRRSRAGGDQREDAGAGGGPGLDLGDEERVEGDGLVVELVQAVHGAPHVQRPRHAPLHRLLPPPIRAGLARPPRRRRRRRRRCRYRLGGAHAHEGAAAEPRPSRRGGWERPHAVEVAGRRAAREAALQLAHERPEPIDVRGRAAQVGGHGGGPRAVVPGPVSEDEGPGVAEGAAVEEEVCGGEEERQEPGAEEDVGAGGGGVAVGDRVVEQLRGGRGRPRD